MSYSKDNQCRNFSPNIFNKNKCQNCFKPRETHLLSDKDLNKAEPIYCGWLLLAPIGTDFENPTHRSRKWQRRYFVLFEHGALRYALDDNANTLPQGTINMNNCSDVVHGEVLMGLTGQKHSICIYLPDMKYFLRSENREDSNGWFDQLIVFPQTAKLDAQRKKRTAKRFTSLKAPSTYTVEHEVPKIIAPAPDEPDGKHSPKSDDTSSKTSPVSDNALLSATQDNVKRGRSISRKSTDMKQGTQTSDYNNSYTPMIRRAKSLDRDASAAMKELLHQRKGWLMKYSNKENFKKHWFVLTEDVLKHYKGPEYEDAFTDATGELNLSKVEKVCEVELSRNYGFSLHTADSELLLAAVTSGIRRNWLNAILKQCKPNIQLTKAEAPDPEKTPTVVDEANIEIRRQRRARIRDRRKMGRSRTYDFAELRSAAKPELSVENDISSAEVHIKSNATFSSETAVSPRMVHRNGPEKLEVSPTIDLHKSNHDEPQWVKIENILNSTSSFSNKAISTLNDLKNEVDTMQQDFDKSQQEHIELMRQSPNFVDDDDNLKGGNTTTSDRSQVRRKSDSGDLKSLEVSYKLSLEENKRLRDEMTQTRLTSQQEASILQTKVSELKTELAKAEKRAFKSNNRSSLKSESNEKSYKARFSELEAEMEDTGQMLAARLSALENPRRRETDESDEVGSNSSCSSLSTKTNKDEARTTRLRKNDNLESTHQRLAEVIKALQEAREAAESSTSLQESLYTNKATVISLKKKMAEDEKKYSSVRQRLLELRTKVTKTRNDKYTTEPQIITFLDSVLEDIQQTIDLGSPQNSRFVDNLEPAPPLSTSSSASSILSAKVLSDQEVDRRTLDKLKTLSEQLKTTGASMSQQSSTEQLSTATGANYISKNISENLPADAVFSDRKANLLAEQLSLQALVVAEMATSLERYNSNSEQSMMRLSQQHIDLQELKSKSDSELLQHSGVLAEKLLLEGYFIRELSNFRVSSSSQNVQTDFSRHQNVEETSGSLSVIQAQINYVLHIYNDRISRLSQDVKESQHRADVFQQKLLELVHACKTKDIELVSQLAVEVDTKASFTQTIEDLPLWRQQVDYGMLHGAQAGMSDLDLRSESAFFTKLAQDVASMSTDMNSLTSVGSRILEIDSTLSKYLKPSEIGEHASIIAYEAISQAQLLFLCKRISNDYEAELAKMKASVKEQSAYCDSLQRKLKESEHGDATKVQELTSEHKLKVERLRQQLEEVEKARYEMETEMDNKLSKLAQMQQREMEKSSAIHKQETEGLRKELNDSQIQLENAKKDYLVEIEELKHSLERIKETNERQISQTRNRYEKSVSKEKEEFQLKIEVAEKENMEKIVKIKADFEEEIEMMMTSQEKKMTEFEERRTAEIENLEDLHAKEMESLRAEKDEAINDITKKLKEIEREKDEMALSEELERSKTEEKQEEQIDELHSMFKQSISDIKQSHKKQLDELAEQYQVEIKSIEEEKAREMDEDVTSTKLAITSMKKHFKEEMERLKSSEFDESMQTEMTDMKRELEALSELYTSKCVNYTQRDKDVKMLEEKLLISENNNEILKEQNDKLSDKFEEELSEMKKKGHDSTKKGSGDINHLKVELSTKDLQISVLKQQMESFKQQVAIAIQGRRYPRHSRFIENEDLPTTQGYGIMKSKSHPDFISFDDSSLVTTEKTSERSTYRATRESPTSFR